MTYRRTIGNFGEDLACQFLIRNGYKILERNAQIGHLEIDIIAKKGWLTVFVEVKTRSSESLGSADQAVDFRKMRSLNKAINIYIEENNLDGNFVRLDLISVDINRQSKKANIKHYKELL